MATVTPQPLSDQEKDELFPKDSPNPPDGTFEIALALAGTVSAGAYTAGVLDYLIEALDAWALAKAHGDADAPKHNVVLRTIAGASGGAINGAAILRTAGGAYPHGPDPNNPLYAAWTGEVDLEHLLATPQMSSSDLPPSLLDCAVLDRQVKKVLGMSAPSYGMRPYLADPLRLTVMVGNVTGIPYRINFTGKSGLGHDLVAHDDHLRFALTIENGKPETLQTRPDERALSSTESTNWDLLGAASLATSAFPFAFKARSIVRPFAETAYRVIVIPGTDTQASEVVQLIPVWQSFEDAGAAAGTETNLLAVDGGTVNNEPIDIARTSLAGWLGRNPREAVAANRAVILVDPFSDVETLGPAKPIGILGLISPLISQFVYQARLKPSDIALAKSETVFSRFLIAPVRPPIPSSNEANVVVGSQAIASGGLGGFIGFVDAKLTKHDFMLGRWNAYKFLTESLYFPPANVALATASAWTQDQMALYADKDGDLPLIPLVKSLRDAPPVPPVWPRLDAMPAGLADSIDGRLDYLFASFTTSLASKNFFLMSFLKAAWKLAGKSLVHNKIMDTLSTKLRSEKLMP
ncbi:patatin-like phospholipase family protein [Mesorhizobium carmichaelinearum]|uniref:patatin-like phospholipase family protein n=1 Tax=Mesorhizobium carmichaelinearum TaxID=1208188 RepID=UPI000BA343F6|nr:patatin-like phospholipase family protein [Mesorhizobium carmichaelinearum]